MHVVTWYGGLGWSWDGYCDVTPISVVFYAMHEGALSESDTLNPIFIDARTGEVIAHDAVASE